MTEVRISSWVAVVAILGLPWTGYGQTADEVVARLAERQAALPRVSISYSLMIDDFRSKDPNVKRRYERTGRLLLSDSPLAYLDECRGTGSNGRSAEPVPFESQFWWHDGQIQAFGKPIMFSNQKAGHVSIKRGPAQVSNSVLGAWVVFRPLDRGDGYGAFCRAGLKVRGKERIDGINVLVVDVVLPEGAERSTSSMYLRLPDLLPVRTESRFSDGCLEQCDVSYREGSSDVFGLTGWRYRSFGLGGRPLEVHTASDIQVDTSIGDSEVRAPKLPLNISYTDETLPTPQMYVYRGPGKLRPIAEGEYDGTNFDELVYSDPPGTRKRWWLWTIGGAAVIVGGIWVLLRRRPAATVT